MEQPSTQTAGMISQPKGRSQKQYLYFWCPKYTKGLKTPLGIFFAVNIIIYIVYEYIRKGNEDALY